MPKKTQQIDLVEEITGKKKPISIEEKRAKNRERVAKYRKKAKLFGKPSAKLRLDTYLDFEIMVELESLVKFWGTTKKEAIERLIKAEIEKVSQTQEYLDYISENYTVIEVEN